MSTLGKEFSDLKSTHAATSKRLKEIQELISIFTIRKKENFNIDTERIELAAQYITKLYFDLLHQEVKKYVPKKINRYKIASLTELCIVHVQPFMAATNAERRKLNAEFAFFASLCIINGAMTDVATWNKATGNKRIDDVFQISKQQRLQWLEAKNPNQFPVFVNGLSLFTLFELYNQRFQALPL